LRDYDPEAGRWTARDPILYASGQVNLYAYSRNDPVGRRDPSGLACIGFSAFALFGAGVDVCMTRNGFSFCGEVGLGFGGGLDLDPAGALASRADADYVKLEVGAECLILGIGTELKLDDCGNFNSKFKVSCGVGPLNPCADRKIKVADVEVLNGRSNPSTGATGASGKLNRGVEKLLNVNPKCTFGAKATGGACWCSDW
jgi:hypothetical protein